MFKTIVDRYKFRANRQEQIYSITDADLYTIHEEMLTLVELHRTQKKSDVKNNEIKRLSNFNFLLEVSLF